MEPLLRVFWLRSIGVQRSRASLRGTRADGLKLRRWRRRRRLESPDVCWKPVLWSVRRSYLIPVQVNQGYWATLSGIGVFLRPSACVSDRRQRETVSGIETSVEAASCSLDAMVRRQYPCLTE